MPLRLARLHPYHVVRAIHDDVVLAGPVNALIRVMEDLGSLGAQVDAVLAPAKCVAWSPARQPRPADFQARWVTDGLKQFSVPLGRDEFVAAAVDKLAAEQRDLTAAIAALPPNEL